MTVKPKMGIDQALWLAFEHFAHMDFANACIHGAPVRFSPLTFRLAEHLDPVERDWLDPRNADLLDMVLDHLGAYEEDPGR